MPDLDPAAVPPLPNLERLLGRGARAKGPRDYAEGLFGLFGLSTAPDRDLPTAAVSFLADSTEPPPGFLMHADPLRLLPDRDSLLAFDCADEGLDADEAGDLIDAFNGHFSDEGLRLLSGSSGRLYLQCDDVPDLRTTPLFTVLGRHIDRYLPAGRDSGRWRGLLNEVQMLCHGLALNQRREQLGQPAVSGLWFSGGGLLPTVKSPAAIKRLHGDCPLARGLMQLAGGSGDDELYVETGLSLAVARADPVAWMMAVSQLERRIPALIDGCEVLRLYPCAGSVYTWDRRAAWRWWRRTRPLAVMVREGR